MKSKFYFIFVLVSLLFSCNNALQVTEEKGMQEKESSRRASSRTPKASALLVGLKTVNPAKYGGWNGASGCWGCEKDVDTMSSILRPIGYSIKTLKTAQATRTAILNEIERASQNLYSGDIFVFYYSGHGGTTYDSSGDEADNQDETLIAYDGRIIDDQLNDLWVKFRSGVRIVMLSDSCHSGTVYRSAPGNIENITDVQTMRASLIHISGCRDSGTSSGYKDGGAFTKALAEAWNNGGANSTYRSFHSEIRNRIKTSQVPEYHEYGPVNNEFRSSTPFSIMPWIGFKSAVNTGISNQGWNNNAKSMDINGDGYKDLVTAYNNKWYVMISNGRGFNSPINTGRSNIGWNNNPQVMDVNGDNKDDLVLAYNNKWHILISNGRGFNSPINTRKSNVGWNNNPQVMDINGDGKDDLLLAYNNKWNILFGAGYNFNYRNTYINNQGWNNNPQVMDINGDGKDDLTLAYNNKWYVMLSKGNGFYSPINTGRSNVGWNTNPQVMDLNNDSRDDLVLAYNNKWYILYSNGRTFNYPVNTNISNEGWNNNPQIMDIDGDGRKDLVVATNNVWNILYNSGNGLFGFMNTGANNIGWNTLPHVIDANHDGKDDLILAYNNKWNIRFSK